MDLAELMMAYLHRHFTDDLIGDFHLGDDVFVVDATPNGDSLMVELLMPDGSTRSVTLTARMVTSEEPGEVEPNLPPGYRLDRSDPDLWVLRRRDGSEVGAFSGRGTDPTEVSREAWRNYSHVRRGLLREAVLAKLRQEIAGREDRFGDEHFLYAVDRLLQEIEMKWRNE